MTRDYLKKASMTSATDASDVEETVRSILSDIEAGGDDKAREYAAKFDRYDGNIILTAEEIAEATALVPEKLKADIRFAHDNVRRFAEAQKSTLSDVEIEIVGASIVCSPPPIGWRLQARRSLLWKNARQSAAKFADSGSISGLSKHRGRKKKCERSAPRCDGRKWSTS